MQAPSQVGSRDASEGPPQGTSLLRSLRQRFRAYKRRQEFQPGGAALFFLPGFFVRRRLYEEVRRFSADAAGALLDFGCGRKPYEPLFPLCRYVGLDIEASGHPSQEKRADVFWDGATIPLGDACMDHVLMIEVLEHLFTPQATLREVHRVLKPGGRLLLTCPFAWPLHEEPYDYARYTPFALEHLLREAGFEIVEMRRTGNHVEALASLLVNALVEGRPLRSPWLGHLRNLLLCSLVYPPAWLLSRLAGSPRKLFLNNVCWARRR